MWIDEQLPFAPVFDILCCTQFPNHMDKEHASGLMGPSTATYYTAKTSIRQVILKKNFSALESLPLAKIYAAKIWGHCERRSEREC
jgi:hypothetical protein